LVCNSTAPVRPEKEVCKNRRAKFDYELTDKFQCGIELKGTEVKAVRAGEVTLQDAFCTVDNGEAFVRNMHIARHHSAHAYDQHEPTRARRLLLNKREILRLRGKQEQAGLSIVPVRLYFSGSWLKLEIALGRENKQHDKREAIKTRDIKKELNRITKLQY